MDRPAHDTPPKGTIMIRTRFGAVALAGYFPSVSPERAIVDDAWRTAAGVQGGPFCFTDAERLMPF
jgi:hypothetical protein